MPTDDYAAVQQDEQALNEERAAWRALTQAMQHWADLHEQRTGHTVWLHRRSFDLATRCFSGCDKGQ